MRANDEIRMTNDELNPNDQTQKGFVIMRAEFVIRASTFLRHSTFELRHSFHWFPLGGCDTESTPFIQYQ
jgi:hypothetical protein